MACVTNLCVCCFTVEEEAVHAAEEMGTDTHHLFILKVIQPQSTQEFLEKLPVC